MKDMTVSKALQWLFIAEILLIFSGLGVVGAILSIVAFVLNLLALYGVSKVDSRYHTAFVLSIVGIVINVVTAIVGSESFAYSLLSVVSDVVALGILYFVVTVTCTHLEETGAGEIAGKGLSVWKLNFICTVISVVLSLLMFIPILNIAAAVVSAVVAIVMLVAYIRYLIFLWKSHKALA